jgi:hypothetical protein
MPSACLRSENLRSLIAERSALSGWGVTINRIHNVVHNASNQAPVVALGHDPNDRLRAGRPDDEPSAFAKAQPSGFDCGFDRGILKGVNAPEAYALQQLRHGLEATANFAYTSSALNDDAHHL